MCQLAAYVGDRSIAPLLLKSLELQESLFGAQATGLGVINESGLHIEKDYGHVKRVIKTTEISALQGTAGIAHSRYNLTARDDARYNTKEMAHPFLNDDEALALMHNGGISNYKEHWDRLKESHVFRSHSLEVDAITDSEVAVHMLNDYLITGSTMDEALRRVASECTGAFLFGCIKKGVQDTVWIANWHQPCVVAIGEDESMFSSSHIGIEHVKDDFERYFEPPKNSLIKLMRGKVEVSPLNLEKKAPFLQLDRNELGRQIVSLLAEKGSLDIVQIVLGLIPDGWAKAVGVSSDVFADYSKNGVSQVNRFIDVLNTLKFEKQITEDPVLQLEGGVEDTPRLAYSLV
jgi:glucosamine 6-phosphate synthetase-like amidotransferase/phosphosugar isomerase protein